MKKASEFLDLWIAGPCQGGVSVDDLDDKDKFWNDAIVKETGTHYGYFVYQSEFSNEPVRIYVNDNDELHVEEASMVHGQTRVEIIRNGFKTLISSDHHLELANNVASIIEMDIDKDVLPF